MSRAPGARQLLKNAVIGSLSGLVLPVTALVTGPLLARTLGPDGRGEMATVISPIFVTMFLASMAVPEGTVYAIASLKLPYREAIASSARLLLAYGLLATGLVMVMAPIIARQAPHLTDDIRWAACALPLLMLALMQRFALTGQRWYRLANLERVTAALLRLASLVALALVGVLNVVTAVWSNIGSNVLTAALIKSIVTHRLRAISAVPAQEGTTRRIAAYGLRGWGGAFSKLVSWRLDTALLATLVAPKFLGFYVVAVSLSEIPGGAVAALKNVIFSEAAHRNSSVLVARATRTIAATITLIALIGWAFAEPIIRLLFGADFAPATEMARILMVAMVFLVIESSVGAGLLSAGRPGLRAVGQVVAALITVCGLALAVPTMGAVAAAWTSLAAYSANCAITVLIFCRVSGLSARQVLLLRFRDLLWLFQTSRSLVRRSGNQAPA